MSYIKIQVVHSKSCPFCEFFIKEVLRPLMARFPDLIVVEFREFAMGFQEYKYKMRDFRSREGLTVHAYSGYYVPKYGRLPEIIIDDKRYIITAMNYITAYKLFLEIKKKIMSLPLITSDIRLDSINSFLSEIEEYLKSRMKDQLVVNFLKKDKVQIVRLYGVPVRVYHVDLKDDRDINEFLRKVDPSCAYIFVCKHGVVADQLAKKLRSKGIEAVGLSYIDFNYILSSNPDISSELIFKKPTCSVT